MLINNRFWVFRNAEGEGAGGGDGSGVPDPSPAPDKLSALEERLARIAGSVDTMTATQRQERAASAITGRMNELTNAFEEEKRAVESAEKALADAYDDGDGAVIARAQRNLTETIAKRERADGALESFKSEVEALKKRGAQEHDSKDDTNLRKWKERHSDWYGVDAEMTKASHEIDRQIRKAGVISVGTQAYFDAVDREMGRLFPDRLGGTPPTAGDGGQRMTPNTSQKGKIQQSIAEGWRRMGINVDDPDTVARMLKNREKAVQKGILPAEPVRGSIIQR